MSSLSRIRAEWPSNTRFTSYKMYAYLVKHLDPLRPEVNWTAGSRNVFVYRLADTYLLAAEAAFLSGNTQKAADILMWFVAVPLYLGMKRRWRLSLPM